MAKLAVVPNPEPKPLTSDEARATIEAAEAKARDAIQRGDSIAFVNAQHERAFGLAALELADARETEARLARIKAEREAKVPEAQAAIARAEVATAYADAARAMRDAARAVAEAGTLAAVVYAELPERMRIAGELAPPAGLVWKPRPLSAQEAREYLAREFRDELIKAGVDAAHVAVLPNTIPVAPSESLARIQGGDASGMMAPIRGVPR